MKSHRHTLTNDYNGKPRELKYFYARFNSCICFLRFMPYRLPSTLGGKKQNFMVYLFQKATTRPEYRKGTRVLGMLNQGTLISL